jgi:hypothetical protein
MADPVESLIGNIAETTQNALGGALSFVGLGGVLGAYSVDDSTLKQSDYDFSYRAFPNNLGNSDLGHYMVININVPVNTAGTSQRTSINSVDRISSLLPNEYSKVDILRFNPNIESLGAAQRGIFSVPRYTRRIKESIALFMPSPMVYTSMNEYENIAMTPLIGGVVGGIVSDVAGLALGGLGGAVGGSLLGGTINGVTNVLKSGPQLAGHPINPRVEILFANTKLRQFGFEILLGPRNEKESETIQDIIQTLRYYAAPEINSATLGLTWIPPAEFDITFFNKGVENTKIPRFNTCVLDRIDVDYSPHAGMFSTFTNGHPVGVRLTLGFTEVEVVHKLRVLQGF